LAGRDIYYDQRYRHSLEMRAILEGILRAVNQEPSAFDAATLAEIRRYTKLFWINTGPYNSLTARKFVLKCSREALVRAAEQAQTLGAIADEPGFLRARIDRLASAFFDASSEPLVTNKTPEAGGDILRDSANNLYSGVSLADLDGFKEAYGLNSRLVKTNGGLVEEVARALPGGEQLEFGTPGEIRDMSLAIFDRSFAVTYALEAVAVLVGLFALSSSLGALVLARRREFGVLRHLGVTRREVGAMLATEGALLALAGAAAGLVLGAAISLVLIYVVNPQSFGWSMDLHPPYAFLLGLAAALLALAMLTAWLSGREAMGMAPVRAVKEDW
jgi:hypothetical protein